MHKFLLNTVAAIGLFAGGALAANAQTSGNSPSVVDEAMLAQMISADAAKPEEARFQAMALNAHYGDLDAYYGDLDAFYGDLDAFYGDLDAFYGDLDAFYGDLDAFYGDLDAFWGDLDAFWGDLDAFWGDLDAFYGDLDAFYGDLDAFWGDLDAFWGDLDAFWGDLDAFSTTTAGDYQTAYNSLAQFYTDSKNKFEGAVQAKTGKNFWKGFAKAIFNKYGLKANDPSSMENLDAVTRAKFFVDWHDGLMMFTGLDYVDHWMTAINWSPAITQDHENGTPAKIGILDFGITDQDVLKHNVTYVGGYNMDRDDAHGSAVVSLITAPYDGNGLMGIAPGVEIAAYNPFDSTDTAGWSDIHDGIVALSGQGADIINMSLGVPGSVLSQEWADIIQSDALQSATRDLVYVKAAGNEGVTQTNDIQWNKETRNDRIIIVGATGVDGQIASFSNRPGETCLLTYGNCKEENKLKYRFITAPGEFMLVSDGNGGFARQSGTSFAAPLVSGTAALIHAYWPWWESSPEETVQVILQSADDLGAPGVDGVYGWGQLNVEAALSPLNWNDLTFYRDFNGDRDYGGAQNASQLKNSYANWNKVNMQNDGASLVAFETITALHGNTSDRDFRVPLSTLIYGQKDNFEGTQLNRTFARHLHQRFVNWATGSASFTDITSLTAPMGLQGEWSMSVSATPYAAGTQVRDGQLGFQTDMMLANAETGSSLRVGYGDGAAMLGSSTVFGFYSDFDTDTGGVNPVLGLASGGAYTNLGFKLNDRVSLAVGMSQTKEDLFDIDPITNQEVELNNGLEDYSAQAANIAASYAATDGLTFNLAYTQLQENDSVLGDQGAGALSFNGGAVTDALTIGSEAALPMGFTIAASATMGRTRTADFEDQSLLALEDGMTSTAFAIGLHKQGVLGEQDQLRFSLAQPLAIEQGTMTISNVEIIDRSTGEKGIVTQNIAIEGQRNFVAEVSYATRFMDGAGELGAFARADLTETSHGVAEEGNTTIGGKISFKF